MDIPKLDIKTIQTRDGRFNVEYARLTRPYNEQVAVFAAAGGRTEEDYVYPLDRHIPGQLEKLI